MGFVEPRISVALIVFVLSPEGELDTVGGDPVPARMLGFGDRRAPAGDLEAALRRAMPWEGLRGVVASRLRPLTPRLLRHGEMVMPMWASGCLPPGGVEALPPGRSGDVYRRALERLSLHLDDPSIVAEAHAELRRALASDPVSHQMVGEGVRLRGLALDGLDELRLRDRAASDVDDAPSGAYPRPRVRAPLPPLLALLPSEFTIEQLRAAVRRVARLDEEELESASNFRRRIAELLEARVLVEVGDVEDAKQKGRPAKLYRFDAESWSGWLLAKVRHLSARELFEARRQRVVGEVRELRVARAKDSRGSDSRGSDPRGSDARGSGAGWSRPDDASGSGAPAGASPSASPAMPLEFRDALPRRASESDDEPRGGVGGAGLGAAPMRPAGGEPSRHVMRALRSPSAAARGDSSKTEIPRSIGPAATPEATPDATPADDDRVARLEAMVRHLALKFEQLSPGGGAGVRRDAGSPEGGAGGAASNPPTSDPPTYGPPTPDPPTGDPGRAER